MLNGGYCDTIFGKHFATLRRYSGYNMTCVFKFMDIKISIFSQNSNMISYCKNYFENYFECVECNDPDVLFSINIVDSFFPTDGYILEKDRPFCIYYNESKKNIILSHIYEEHNHELMRLIRELFVHYIAVTKRSCFFHAACVAKGNKAIAIIGDKFAGKTTMCLTLLSNGWDFISNDKLILELSGKDKIVCWGLPIALGIREGTKQIFSKNLYDINLDLEDNRYYLTPNQVIDRFSTKIANGCTLKLFLMPQFSPEAEEITYKKLQYGEIKEIIQHQHLNPFYSEKKRISSLKEETNLYFENDLYNIPVYSILINENLNHKINNTIMQILKQEEIQND